MNKTILVAGGDLRQVHLANLFAQSNTVYAIGFNEYIEFDQKVQLVTRPESVRTRPDYLILPVSACTDGGYLSTPLWDYRLRLAALLDGMERPSLVFGGILDSEAEKVISLRGLSYINYLQREELAVLNAVPTAEGALQIMMEELPTTIYGQKCLMTGFGRISKVLTKYLTALGASLTIAARKYSDLAWARIYGAQAVRIPEMQRGIEEYTAVINTVPALIFSEEILSKLKKGCLVIDLASKPGGVDFETANRLGLKAIWALSLPGKTAPITSGEIVYDTICNILQERGEV
ncbi:MAG TPA: dipicolinate synthase subunit DpsA [Firmicutes bacterium]|nr:dipicolinate synthase subunit DpsA [Bacillota bacterium]